MTPSQPACGMVSQPSGIMRRVEPEGAAGEANLSSRVIMDDERPSDLLAQAVAIVDSTAEPDTELIDSVGAGALETLVRNHGAELWEEIERLARERPFPSRPSGRLGVRLAGIRTAQPTARGAGRMVDGGSAVRCR